MGSRPHASGPQPLELPDGLRLVGENMPDGRAYTVRLSPVESHPWGIGHVPATCCGDFPMRQKAPRKVKAAGEAPGEVPGLFDVAGIGPSTAEPPLIVVYASAERLDVARIFANVLWRRGYNAEARLEGSGT